MRKIAAPFVAALVTVSFVAAHAFTVYVVRPGGERYRWRTSLSSPDGAVEFVHGPETPPLGEGSLRLYTGSHPEEAAQMRYAGRNGRLLANLETLTYWTYAVSNDGGQWPYVILNVDHDSNGSTDDLLFFEPYYQRHSTGSSACPDQGPPLHDTWQDWDAANGCWWSLGGFVGANPGADVKPLDTYVTAFPDTRLTRGIHPGNLRLVQGFSPGSAVFDAYVDAVSIDIPPAEPRTFDFEPAE